MCRCNDLTLLSQLLTGGLFGRPVSHSDIGGYTNVFHPSNTSLVYNRSKVPSNPAFPVWPAHIDYCTQLWGTESSFPVTLPSGTVFTLVRVGCFHSSIPNPPWFLPKFELAGRPHALTSLLLLLLLLLPIMPTAPHRRPCFSPSSSTLMKKHLCFFRECRCFCGIGLCLSVILIHLTCFAPVSRSYCRQFTHAGLICGLSCLHSLQVAVLPSCVTCSFIIGRASLLLTCPLKLLNSCKLRSRSRCTTLYVFFMLNDTVFYQFLLGDSLLVVPGEYSVHRDAFDAELLSCCIQLAFLTRYHLLTHVRPAFFSAVCLCRDDHHPSSSRFVGALLEHAGEAGPGHLCVCPSLTMCR